MNLKRRKREDRVATFDMTPMIDAVFQLLIFFIVCTRFKQEERSMRSDLPTDAGPLSDSDVPGEQVTIYCQWDAASGTNQYVVAIAARGRKLVQGSCTALADLVTSEHDSLRAVKEKRQRYERLHAGLVEAVEDYVARSGAKIERIEVSFAVNAREGAKSGTAPWAFVALAIDATTGINDKRKACGQPKLNVAFKFADALGRMPAR